MTDDTDATPLKKDEPDEYRLEHQVGFLLRRAQQRHLSIFASQMTDELTAQQFAVLARARDMGPVSQNELGRRTAMDQSTINGVVQRLLRRGFLKRRKSPNDKRMILLDLTPEGGHVLERALPLAVGISEATLAPLDRTDRAALLALLSRIC